jgi:tripartite-type tricarboxylate transporter receptor subunit TctC
LVNGTINFLERIMKRFEFSKLICVALSVSGPLIAVTHANAQATANYPGKPIRVFIGFAPGGPADICGRVIGPKLSEVLGQAVVIENRGGAGGTIGMELVAKAAPDGYTLGLGSSGNLVVAPHLYPKIGYSVQKDLAPVSQLAVTAYVIAVNPSVPAKSVRELIKLALSKKDLLSYGSSGSGASSHVAAELFSAATGASMVHVPYKGTGPALTAVVSGEIDLMFADLIPALPHAQNSRLRLLATLGSKRPAAAPNLPTLTEAGVKMHAMDGRYGIVAPVGTPREIIAKLHGAIVTVLKTPEVQQRFAQIGFDIVGDTPEQFASTLKIEGDVIGPIIRKAGIKPDA